MKMQLHYTVTFTAKRNEVPEVTVKVSSSLDGKQATDFNESKWITNKEVKEDVYQLRHEHDAVITGRRTIEADNPLYTTRVLMESIRFELFFLRKVNSILINKYLKILHRRYGFTLKMKN